MFRPIKFSFINPPSKSIKFRPKIDGKHWFYNYQIVYEIILLLHMDLFSIKGQRKHIIRI